MSSSQAGSADDPVTGIALPVAVVSPEPMDLLATFTSAAARAVVARRTEGVFVAGPAEQWAYAARCEREAWGVANGAARISLTVRSLQGRMSVGVLSRDERAFLIEQPLPVTDRLSVVHLFVEKVELASCLVIRTYEPSGSPPELLVADMTVEAFAASEPAAVDSPAALHVDPLVDGLWPYLPPELSINRLRALSREDLERRMTGDRVLDNLLLNKWEFAVGETTLRSFPWRFSVPFVLCNAKCDFCAAWLVRGEPVPIDLIEACTPVLEHSLQVDLVGWGEPLIHPQFAEIVDLVKSHVDARARISLTTNGVRLGEWVDRLLEARVSHFSISIHAATPETHMDVMGLPAGSFPKIIEGVRYLIERRRTGPKVDVGMVFIVMAQNIAEVPAFIDLCEGLGIDRIFFRTLAPMDTPPDGLNYHRLPPYLNPDFEQHRKAAIDAIQRSRAHVTASPETWSNPVFPRAVEATLKTIPITSREDAPLRFLKPPAERSALSMGEVDASYVFPPLDNIYDREVPLLCPSPYTAFYANGFDRKVNPCCYMEVVPGYKQNYFRPNVTFEEVWNAPSMTELRRRLRQGPLDEACLKCPFYW